MNSVTTLRFRKAYSRLPENIKETTRKAYRLWKKDTFHASLQFKQVHSTHPIFSVRINISYRALGVKEGNTLIWFWVGSHAEYDKLLRAIK